MRSVTVVVFIAICMSLSSSVDADEQPEKFIDSVSPDVIEIICSSDYFLSRASMSSGRCRARASRFSEMCLDLARPLIPTFPSEDDQESDDAFAEQIGRLSTLYGMCLKIGRAHV